LGTKKGQWVWQEKPKKDKKKKIFSQEEKTEKKEGKETDHKSVWGKKQGGKG